jgi:hypothetical protein
MKLLFLAQADEVADQQGYHEAIIAAQNEGLISEYQNIPYLGFAKKHGWKELWDEIVKQCRQHSFDVVYFQYFHSAGQSSSECIYQLRRLPCPPLIAASCGDPFTGGFFNHQPQREFVELVAAADVTFLTSMGSLAEYLAKKGAKRLMFVPHAFSEVVFQYPPKEVLSEKREFDVVFVGSCPCTRNPFKVWAKRHEAGRRMVVNKLYKRYGTRFGLFGTGWHGNPAWQGPIPFREQQAAYWRGSLVVDARPPFFETYYASDRPFYVAGSGVPLVQHYTPRFEKIFADNLHTHYIRSNRDIVRVCDRVLDMDASTREHSVCETLELVKSKHLNRHRMRDMLVTCGMVREAINRGKLKDLAYNVPMSHFLPNVDLSVERRHALINW